MLTKPKIAMLAAELLGTIILVLSVLTLSQTTSVTYFIATTVGVTLGLLVMVFGPISGGHFNPAVTFGMWTARKIETMQAIAFIAVQLLGGWLALQLYQYLTDKTVSGGDIQFDTPLWLAEVIGTMVFTMGITAAVTRGYEALQSAITIGASLFLGVLLAAIVSAGLLNPAVALGLDLWSSAYVFGPLLGAVLGINIYMMLFAPERPKSLATKAKAVVNKAKTKKKK